MKNLIVVLFTVLCFTTHAQKINLQNVVDTFILNNKIPAAAIAVIQLDTMQYAVSGVNKKTDGQAVQLSSKFHLGSNSKAITSFMAAKLVEEGKINWDTKLVDVLPSLKQTIHPKFQTVTLEQLLSHTAGIRAYTGGLEFLALPKFEGNTTEQRRAFAAHTLTNDTFLKVGDYAYSNAGYGIAAAMLEEITQKSWENMVKQTLEDVKTPNFYVGFPNRENVENPWGHWLQGTKTLQPVAPDNDYKLESIIAPAGDISMNIVDYAKFVQLHLKGLSGENNYLKAETYQKMHFGKEKYALGWGNGKNPAGLLVSTHNGSAGNFYCHTILIPEKKIAIIVVVNASSPSINDAIMNIRRNLFSLLSK